MTENDTYRVLAEKHGYPDSIRYRRILEFLMTPQQARIAVELPKPPDELSAKLGIDVATVNQELDRLFRKGVVFPKNYQTLENCRFARNVMQLHDASQSALRLDTKRHRKIFELWDDFVQNEWYRDEINRYTALERASTRIIPAYQAIKDIPGILPYEDARELVKAANTIAVVSCTCRKRAEAVGKKCQKSHDAVCLQFNRGAEYALSRGTGTRLSVEEALEIIKETEEDALVHTWINTSSMYFTVMCNCCSDCCEVIEPMLRYQAPMSKAYAKTRFEARVDQSLCDGCQVCVDRCCFEAIEMVKQAGSKKLKALVDPEKCMGCGLCVIGCDPRAINFEIVRPPEHIPSA